MKNSLQILILDEKKQMFTSLTKYLQNRFGKRLAITNCSDSETSLQMINPNSHVLILDYLEKNEQWGINNASEIFNRIKSKNSQNQILILTANEYLPEASLEIELKASQYVLRREQYMQKIKLLFDENIMPTFTKEFREYNVKDFILMFIIAFGSMAIIYFACLSIFVV